MIQDRVAQTKVQWQAWNHLLKIVNKIQEWADASPRKPLYIIVFKSRQVGLTTLLAGIASWLCVFFENSKVLEISKKEKDASDMLDKSRFIIEKHPDWLKLKLEPDQQSELGLPATYGVIQALPSTKDAGRSTDATMVLADEWEYHPYAEENFAAVKPAIDKGGLFIGVSTIDKTNFLTFAKSIYYGAKDGSNRFTPFFFDYFVVPFRTQETYLNDIAGLPEWQKEQEYPRNEQEALSVPMSTCFFDREAIKEMWKECSEPIEVRYGGKIKIFKNAVFGRKYCFSIDPSEGQDDPCAGVVTDWQTEEDVAFLGGKMSWDEQAKLAFELYKEYNEPFMGVEKNAGGSTLIEKLKNMGVTNWYYYREGKEGWATSSSNRPVMLNELGEGISLRLLRIPYRDALEQFLDFQWIDGKPQAVRGRHDDWIFAHGIGRQIRKMVKIKIPGRAVSFKYKQEF